MKSRKDGEDITIPLEYLKQLESRIAELDRPSAATHDVGVQTDFSNQLPGPHTAALSGVANSAPEDLDPTAQQLFNTPDDYPQNDLLRHVAASDQDLLRVSDMRSHAPRLEGALISRLAYEVYPDRPGWDLYAGTDTESPHAEYPFWQEEVYANLYFSITHWVWPFLDSGAWRTWRQEWDSDSEADQWKGFLVKMVLAIGALSCNVLQPSQDHSAHAADLYTAAMAYYPYVMGHESAILQIQASILMILYALQCPSAEEISTAVSSIVPFCTATVADMRKHAASGNGGDLGRAGGPGEILTETLFITCFMLNEIVVSGWDRPVSASYRAIDDDVRSPHWVFWRLSNTERFRSTLSETRCPRPRALARRCDTCSGCGRSKPTFDGNGGGSQDNRGRTIRCSNQPWIRGETRFLGTGWKRRRARTSIHYGWQISTTIVL